MTWPQHRYIKGMCRVRKYPRRRRKMCKRGTDCNKWRRTRSVIAKSLTRTKTARSVKITITTIRICLLHRMRRIWLNRIKSERKFPRSACSKLRWSKRGRRRTRPSRPISFTTRIRVTNNRRWTLVRPVTWTWSWQGWRLSQLCRYWMSRDQWQRKLDEVQPKKLSWRTSESLSRLWQLRSPQ